MTPQRESQRRPFNSPLESGLRVLFLLAANSPHRFDLQRLVFIDYLLVHSADPEGGPPSLHAPVPHRAGEWMVRRELLLSGVDLMFAKELLQKHYDGTGILVEATDLTQPFLNHLTSAYASRLRERAEWVCQRFGAYSDDSLSRYMGEHLGRWGAEFKRESVVRPVRI